MRNYWIDVVMGVLALTLGLSALLLWVVLPQSISLHGSSD